VCLVIQFRLNEEDPDLVPMYFTSILRCKVATITLPLQRTFLCKGYVEISIRIYATTNFPWYRPINHRVVFLVHAVRPPDPSLDSEGIPLAVPSSSGDNSSAATPDSEKIPD
jgi:hypothetical protein